MFVLTVRESFCASHALRGYDGPCAHLHGHNFHVELRVRGRRLDAIGMLVDFRDLKRTLRAVLGELDHTHLNDHPAFAEQNATAENIARYLYRRVAQQLPAGVGVDAVTVWETERAGATYREDEGQREGGGDADAV